MRPTLVAAASLAFLAGWGCQVSDEATGPAPEMPPSSGQVSDATQSTVPAPAAEPANSAAQHTVIGRIPHPLEDGTEWGPVALTDRGMVIASLRTSGGDQAALINPRTGETTRLGEPQPGGLFAADSDRRHVVWVTSEATDLFTMPWTLWSYDRRTGEVRKLAQAPDVGVTPVPAAPDGTTPSLLGQRVYYTAVRKVVRGRPVPAVYSVDVAGGPPRVEVNNAFSGTITRAGLYFLRAQTGSFTRWSINLKNGRSVRVIDSGGPDSRISGGAFDRSGAVIWQESVKENDCRVHLTRHGVVTQVWLRPCRRGWSYYLDITTAFATGSPMSEETGAYVPWILRSGATTPHDLGSRHGTVRGIEGAGRYLMWTPTASKADTVIARLRAATD